MEIRTKIKLRNGNTEYHRDNYQGKNDQHNWSESL